MNLFTFNVHVQNPDGKQILHELKQLKNIIMATSAEWTATFVEMKAGLANIAADITRLTDAVQGGSLSQAEEDAAFAELRGLADQINTIAAVTPEPETPPTT